MKLTIKRIFMRAFYVMILTAIAALAVAIVKPMLALSTIAPAIAYLLYIWRKEKVEREPLIGLYAAFSYGFTVSVVLALALSILIIQLLQIQNAILITILISPTIEEISKLIGVIAIARVRGLLNEIDDGIIYGASAGLGFSAFENMMYAYRATDPILVGLLRAISSTAAHAASTAIAGYGYAKATISPNVENSLSGYLIIAIALHATHNAIAMIHEALIPIIIAFDLLALAYILSKIE